MNATANLRTTAPKKRVKRRKRTQAEARSEVLTEARALLLADGPNAVTLANIGRGIGMTYPNVIHHFGSAGELQSALMGSMIRDLTVALDETVAHIRSDKAAPRAIVDMVFDAFGSGGAGQLAAWIVLSREFGHLEPVRDAVQTLVKALREKFSEAGAESRIRKAVLFMALIAFADSVIGDHMRDMLNQKPDAARKMTTDLLGTFLVA